MPRYLKLVLWLLSGLLLLCAVAVFVISVAPLNWARPWLNNQLSDLTHRQVQISGDIRIDWKRHDVYDGWRAWFPWPVLIARDVEVGNPDWATTGPTMAQAQAVRFQLDPFGLGRHVVRLADLTIVDGQLVLERQADGSNNWTFGDDDPAADGAGWQVKLDRLMLQDASLRVLDMSRELDVTVRVDTSDADQEYGTRWSAQGHYHGVEVSGEGQLGHVLALQNLDQPFPVQGVLHVGATSLEAQGTVTRAQGVAALDVVLELSGPTMADLYPILGLALPNTPPYTTSGRLRGNLDKEHGTWVYEDFTGTVGDSDLGGNLKYERREPRPLLTATLHSDLLRFEDLGPLIGAPAPESSEAKDGETPDGDTPPSSGQGQQDAADGQLTESVEQPDGKALPVEDADSNVWAVMDADVTFEGRRIESTVELPLDDVRAHVFLDDSVLRFEPLDFGVAGGNFESEIVLDGNADPIQASLEARASGLQLSKLFPGVESMDAALGSVYGNATLDSRGDSVAELMAHASGELNAVVSRGTVSRFLLEAAGLNVANMVFVKLFGDEQVTVQCLAAAFKIQDGLMDTRTFILETEDAVVTVAGTINLATEVMDLDIHPENKSLRIFTLRSPLYVAGTFKNPDIGVQTGPVAARAGAAVALGLVATPLAAILPLLNIGTDDETTCAALSGDGASDKVEASTDDDGRMRGTVQGAHEVE